MTFISEIDIKEFRGISYCKNPIQLSKFSIIIGRNNSAKSTFLEALSLMPMPFKDERIPYYDENRLDLIRSLHGNTSLVYGYSGTASIKYKMLKKSIEIDLDASNHIKRISFDGEDKTNINEYRKKIQKLLNLKNNENIQSLIFFIPDHTGYKDKLFTKIQESKDYRDTLTKKGINISVVKELINKCVDDKYSEILTDSTEMRLRKQLSKKLHYIHLTDLGDGIRKATIMALILQLFDPKLILWDDFENSAHPSLIKILLKWLSEKNWQIVISTHSIDVLNNIIKIKPKDANILLFKKNADDVLLTKSYNIDEFEDLMYSNTDPRLLSDTLEL